MLFIVAESLLILYSSYVDCVYLQIYWFPGCNGIMTEHWWTNGVEHFFARVHF